MPTQAGGVAGPIFSGDLSAAFPPVIGGQRVQVLGPGPASEADTLDEWTLALIDQLGVDRDAAQIAFASDSGNSVVIFALRLPGASSAAIDHAYTVAQDAAPGTSNFRVVSIAGRNVRAFDSAIGTTYAWVNGDVLFTVYGTEQGAQQAIATMPFPTVALEPGGEVLPDALVDLTITGGPVAGEYHGETSIGGCSRDALGENQFGLQYSDDENVEGFTSLQLIVRDAAAAETEPSEEFSASFQIGPYLGGQSYQLDPANDEGSGTVSIESTGTDSATVEISGVTANGVQIEATVTCNVIFDFGG